jgi:hypothetical protein
MFDQVPEIVIKKSEETVTRSFVSLTFAWSGQLDRLRHFEVFVITPLTLNGWADN